MAGLNPTTQDDPHPQKNPSITYDPQMLPGTIPVGGSITNSFDLNGWSEFALQIAPSGTILGGTTLNIWASNTLQGSYYPVYGTTGAVAATLQIGSTGNQIITQINVLKPLRFVQFVAGGTQSAAQTFNLLVK